MRRERCSLLRLDPVRRGGTGCLSRLCRSSNSRQKQSNIKSAFPVHVRHLPTVCSSHFSLYFAELGHEGSRYPQRHRPRPSCTSITAQSNLLQFCSLTNSLQEVSGAWTAACEGRTSSRPKSAQPKFSERLQNREDTLTAMIGVPSHHCERLATDSWRRSGEVVLHRALNVSRLLSSHCE